MSQLIHYFLYGLTVLSPVFSVGIIPSSFQGMTRKPSLAVTYALAGFLYIMILPLLGWTIYKILPPDFHLIISLPLMIAILWAVRILLGLVLQWTPRTKVALNTGYNGCLALGSGILLAGAPGYRWDTILATACGMAIGYWFVTVALSYIRERIERLTPRALRGWPILLLLCSSLWLAIQALGIDLP